MIPLPLLERTIIDAALRFASLPGTPAPADVEAIFWPVAGLSQASHFKSLQAPVAAIPNVDAAAAYASDHAELVDWLEKLRHWRRVKARDKARVYSEIQGRLGRTVEGRTLWELTDEGAMRSFTQPRLTGVQACYSFAAALLADTEQERWTRLGRCELKSCRRWFWDPDARPDRKYCCDAHGARTRKARHDKRKGKGR